MEREGIEAGPLLSIWVQLVIGGDVKKADGRVGLWVGNVDRWKARNSGRGGVGEGMACLIGAIVIVLGTFSRRRRFEVNVYAGRPAHDGSLDPDYSPEATA
jgi:hypothetical protein